MDSFYFFWKLQKIFKTIGKKPILVCISQLALPSESENSLSEKL